MRYLIVSDIHSNWEALEAVLEHAGGKYDQILCCGDLVGYGADPNAVVGWTREHVAAVVRGNHDKACTGSEDLEWFNPVAQVSALWTHRELSAENLDYLRMLPKGPMPVESFQILHGSPLDEDEYLVNAQDVADISSYLGSEVSFFGHTHLQGGFACNGRRVRRLDPPPRSRAEKALALEPDVAYLINPGAVGQPRDGDPRASFVLYAPEERSISYFRVPYDVLKAQEKILSAGLPEVLAARLALGN